jgi:hypothetical protein
MAVPGPITSMTSAGCNAFIRDHRAAWLADGWSSRDR